MSTSGSSGGNGGGGGGMPVSVPPELIDPNAIRTMVAMLSPSSAWAFAIGSGTTDGINVSQWRLWQADSDSFVYQLPVTLPMSVYNFGDYELHLVTVETNGRVTIGAPIPMHLRGNVLPPAITLENPMALPAAGNNFSVKFQAWKNGGAISRVTLTATGAVAAGSTQAEIQGNGQSSMDSYFELTVAQGAQPGDVIDITVTAFDDRGNSDEATMQVSVGTLEQWTVEVTGDTYASNDMFFRPVVVRSGGILRCQWEAPMLDSLVVEAGGQVIVNSYNVPELRVNTALRLDTGGVLSIEPSYLDSKSNPGGGAHGGDASNPLSLRAFGDFRHPNTIGGSAYGYPHYYCSWYSCYTIYDHINGGGAMRIEAPQLIVNGTIQANGQSLTAAQSRYSGGYGGGGAGGSLAIDAGDLSGTGTIQANGGDVFNAEQGSGAGGRIAVYYNTYNGGAQDASSGLHLEALAGQASTDATHSGAGTVFLKRPDQLYGDLLLDAGGRFSDTSQTTLRSVGRWTIGAIAPVAGTSDRYRVDLLGTPNFEIPDVNDSKTFPGLRGLQVRLNANDPLAPLYPVVDNGANYLIVQAGQNISSNVGNDLIGVIRLDKLQISEGVHLAVKDTIHADENLIEDPDSLALVDDIYSPNQYHVGALNLSDSNQVYLGDLYADSLNLSNSKVRVTGQTVITGNVSLSAGATLAATTVAINGQLILNNASLSVDQLSGITALSLTNSNLHVASAQITVPSSVSMTNSIFSLAQGRLAINGDLELIGGSLSVPDLAVSGQWTIQGAQVQVAQLALGANLVMAGGSLTIANGPLQIPGNVQLSDVGVFNAPDLSIGGQLTMTGGAQLTTGSIDVAQAGVVNNAAITTVHFGVQQDLSLENNAILTVQTTTGMASQALELSVGQALRVQTGAVIDANGKGYLAQHTWNNAPYTNTYTGGSHGGIGGLHPDTNWDHYIALPSYGDFYHPAYPGSGGNNSVGGGVIHIDAAALFLDGGIIRANGTPYQYGSDSGAGGSIDLHTGLIEAVGSANRIEANGGGDWSQSIDHTGAGGRVRIRYAQNNGLNWQYVTARAGASSSSYANFGSAGTVLIHQLNQYPVLKVVSYDPQAGRSITSTMTTNLEVFGQQVIAAVEVLPNQRWGIDVQDSLDADKNYVGYLIDLDADDFEGPYYEVVAVEGSHRLIVQTSDDLSAVVGNTLAGAHRFERVEVTGSRVDFGQDRVIVDDLADIQASTDSQIRINMPSNLITQMVDTNPVGAWTILGDHSLSTLTLDGYDLNVARLHITGDLNVGNTAALSAELVDVNNIMMQNGIISAHQMDVAGDLSVLAGSSLTAATINAGDIMMQSSTATVQQIHVTGNLSMAGSVITSPACTATQCFPLTIDVTELFSVHSGSAIDVSGKGYVAQQTVNNTNYSSSNAAGSHAGQGGSSSGQLVAYGDYQHPSFPGAGSSYKCYSCYPNIAGYAGGGVVTIIAERIEINQGSILANGQYNAQDQYFPTGAGGSINIQTNTIAQSGSGNRIEANGGGSWTNTASVGYTGGGGRIRVQYNIATGFSLASSVACGGPSPYSSSYVNYMGSAGTVFLQAGNVAHLKISNTDSINSSNLRSSARTPMEVIGHHPITAVTLQQGYSDRWVITTSDTLAADKNYIGYLVDLNASEFLSPHYPIVGQVNANQLVVQTNDNLAAANLVGNYFIGVHNLETLTVQSWTTADFGWDRVIVNNTAGSIYDTTSNIISGDGSVLPTKQ
ncbi:MAG: hypothetical protein M0036_19220 [Desulfobacteraceae bacterium]|nr:hypothetical protein [Desulfobacteraceae bacterium]